MPTYQYSCTECGHFFEQFQSFSEDSLTVCPQCQGRLRKVFNAVGVVFKGSGFYRTDSRTSDGADSGSGATKDGGPAEKTAASEKGTSAGSTGTGGGTADSGTSTSGSGGGKAAATSGSSGSSGSSTSAA